MNRDHQSDCLGDYDGVASETSTESSNSSDVTVVVPAYGECPYLRQVVVALLDQSIPPTSIVVVHSGPFDPTAELNSLRPRVRLAHRDNRTLAGEARNIGVSQTETKWIAFLDADVLPDRNWLKGLLESIKQSPRRFVVGSVGFASEGGYWGLCRWMIEFSSFHPYMPEGEIKGGGAGNMLVAVDDVRRAGGFPAKVQAAEDILLFAKMRELGLVNWFCPMANGGHFNVVGFGNFYKHLCWLGEWSVRARRAGHLPFDLATRWPPVSIFLGPARFLLISYRIVRWGKKYRWMWFRLIPGLLLGLAIWNIAFTIAAIKPEKV